MILTLEIPTLALVLPTYYPRTEFEGQPRLQLPGAQGLFCCCLEKRGTRLPSLPEVGEDLDLVRRLGRNQATLH